MILTMPTPPPKFTWNLKMMVSKARISTDSFSGEPSEVLGIVCLSSYVVTVVLFPVAHVYVYCLTNYLIIYGKWIYVTCAEDLKEDAERERNWTSTLLKLTVRP